MQEDGYRVYLANTAAIKRYEGLKHSGEEDDAVSGALAAAGDLLESAQVNGETVRYYQRRGLMREAARPTGSVQLLCSANIRSRLD